MNGQIRISPIRVVTDEGEMLGEMETHKALELAVEQGLDLVEVSPNARPPVCRIMDYGKVLYERKKKQSTGSKQHRNQLKQIRLRAKTGQHDIEVKVRKAREFLERRDKVKVNVLFKGARLRITSGARTCCSKSLRCSRMSQTLSARRSWKAGDRCP